MQLHQEITALGYPGNAKSVRRYLHPLRAGHSSTLVMVTAVVRVPYDRRAQPSPLLQGTACSDCYT